ncbi:MAG: prepilin-type N-terminal cleavage/methylation domain-containing protein [Candidatus Saccharibacteria bacterium]|nr:prepilin-type N-terminal cleavage/methylation domain-containing protein [Candidatus Saccharibacteria bacterium]
MKRGFTIIELMVVIAAIVIVAAIAVVGYDKWNEKAVTDAIHADLSAAATAMEQEKNFKGVYPGSSSCSSSQPCSSALPSSFKSHSANIKVYIQNSGHNFCLEGTSNAPGLKFHIRSSSNKIQTGGCD